MYAKKVFSVDVGYGQFAWKLRTDERVVCMERTNIRYVTPEDIGEKLDFASIDVSFISLRTIMPAVKELLKDNGWEYPKSAKEKIQTIDPKLIPVMHIEKSFTE